MTLPSNVAGERPAKALRPMASTYAYFAAIMALGLMSASLGPTLPGLAEQTGSAISQISFLFLARSTGYMLGSLLGGKALDMLPGHSVLAVAVAVISVAMFAVPLLPVLWILAAVLAIAGLAEGSVDVGSNALLVWVHRSAVGPYMQGLHFFFGVGAFLSPIIVVQVMELTGGIKGPYWVLALIILPVALWLARLASPRPIHESQGEDASLVNWTLVGMIALFMFIYVGAEVSFGGWIYTYATTLGIASAQAAGYLTSVYWGGLTAGRVLAIPIANRYRPRTILLGDLVGCLLSVGIILVWRESSLALWVGAIGLGLSMASIFPTVILWAERRMTLTGSVTRWFFVGASLGAMAFPWLVGQFFDRRGPSMTMVIVFGLLVVNVVIFYLLMHLGGEARPVPEKERVTQT